MPPFADQPWAKLTRNADQSVAAALPLVDHCCDVAAVFEALLAGAAWARALAQAAGRELTAQDHARLVALAALHDLGKANAGFQARWHPKAPPIGHEGQVAALLLDPGLAASPAGVALHAIRRDWGAAPFLPALMAHHGRPREEFGPPASGTKPWEAHVRHWRPANGYDPVTEVTQLIAQVRARWPLAWQPGGPLPAAARFVALFAGLVTLADWIGSDERRFPVDKPHGGARDAIRSDQAARVVTARGLVPLATPATDFSAAFGLAHPRGVQTQAAAGDLGPVALIEAETGSGKTEAALWRWLALRRQGLVDGLYFALPTRSAAVQLHARVQAMLTRVWGAEAPEAVLALPGYLRAGESEGEPLPGREVRWDDIGLGAPEDARWAAERTNRFLAARVAVGTIDQALLGALRVRHAPVRAASLARSLLVVDEVHASDAYVGRLLERLLDNHVGAGGQALLLSATLGATMRARLLGGLPPALAEAEAQPYPALSGRGAPLRPASPAIGEGGKDRDGKRVTVAVRGLIEDADAVADLAITAARAGASVLVIRNSVGGAVAVARAVEARAPDLAFCVEDVATVHHGRFAPTDRRLLDAAVEDAFGKKRSAKGRVLVGTQTLEQSLDIDADLLLTDLAPMDVLLQRIGRLHRHARDDRGAFAAARVVVLRPAVRDLLPLLGRVRERHGLGPMKDGGGAYPNLLQLEATLRLLEAEPTIVIPRDNRRLVERSLHPEILATIAAEGGTPWANHAADCNAIAYGDRDTAEALSLDLAKPFRDLLFPSAAEAVATRLGARDLLVDLAPALDGPFAKPVDRLAIPHWMAGRIPPDSQAMPIDRDVDGCRFQLGERVFTYGRWGLAPA